MNQTEIAENVIPVLGQCQICGHIFTSVSETIECCPDCGQYIMIFKEEV